MHTHTYIVNGSTYMINIWLYDLYYMMYRYYNIDTYNLVIQKIHLYTSMLLDVYGKGREVFCLLILHTILKRFCWHIDRNGDPCFKSCRSRIRSAGIQHGCNRSRTKTRSVLPKKLWKKAVFTRSEFIGTCACLEIKKLHKAMEIWLMFIIIWLWMLSLRLDRTLWIATARESRMARGWPGANWNGKTQIGLKESTWSYRIALRPCEVTC